jgi:hypothetical protein
MAHILPAGANAPACQESTKPAAVPTIRPGPKRLHGQVFPARKQCRHPSVVPINEDDTAVLQFDRERPNAPHDVGEESNSVIGCPR